MAMTAGNATAFPMSNHTRERVTVAKITLETFYSNLILQHEERETRYCLSHVSSGVGTENFLSRLLIQYMFSLSSYLIPVMCGSVLHYHNIKELLEFFKIFLNEIVVY